MKIQHTNKHRKIIILGSIIGAVVLVAAAIYVFSLMKTSQESPVQSSSSNNTPQNSSQNEEVGGSVKEGSGDKTITPTENTQQSESIEAPSITRVDQQSGGIKVVAIFARSTSGTCTLTAQKAAVESVSSTVDVIVGPSYYTCNGFLIDLKNFSEKGEWNFTVTHELNGQKATSQPVAFTIL